MLLQINYSFKLKFPSNIIFSENDKHKIAVIVVSHSKCFIGWAYYNFICYKINAININPLADYLMVDIPNQNGKSLRRLFLKSNYLVGLLDEVQHYYVVRSLN